MSEIKIEKRQYPQGDEVDWTKIQSYVDVICETFNLKELLCLGAILEGVFYVRRADMEKSETEEAQSEI